MTNMNFDNLFYEWGLKPQQFSSEFDVRKYVEEHFEPVEDEPGYVWFSKRNMQIISIDVLVAALLEYWNKEVK